MNSADQAMSQYAQGDLRAFDLVYESVAPRIESYLRRHVRDKEVREDIVQQTFLQMHSARGTFILGAEVMPWAFAIARRLMIDSGRKARRENHCEIDEEDISSQISAILHLASGEALYQARELNLRFCRAYGELSEPQRSAFDLVNMEGLSHAQAALALGTTVSGIKLRVHRAYLALRKAVTEARPVGATPPVSEWETTATKVPPALSSLGERR